MSELKAKRSKPWWWKPFWIVTLLLAIASGVAGFFLLNPSLARAIGGVAFTFLVIGIAYYIRIRPSIELNKAIYITFGAGAAGMLVQFGSFFIFTATGVPSPSEYLGIWEIMIVFFIAPNLIGGYIGYWIGKRRDYILPSSH